jgi:hypothetical protein
MFSRHRVETWRADGRRSGGTRLLAKYVRVTVHHVDGPVDGLVLNWREVDGALQGLVTYELKDRVVTDWVPAMSLTPLEAAGAGDDDPDAVPSPG